MTNSIRKLFEQYSLHRKLVLVADLGIVGLGFLLATILRFNLEIGMVSLAELLAQLGFAILPTYLLAFVLTGSYRGILRHSSIDDAGKLFSAISIATGLSFVPVSLAWLFLMPDVWTLPPSIILIHAPVTFILLMGFRLVTRSLYQAYGNQRGPARPVLIFGAGELGQITLNVLENDGGSSVHVVGFIDDNKLLHGKMLAGNQIYSEKQAFEKIVESKDVHEIILAIDKEGITRDRKKKFLDRCLAASIVVREVPPIKNWIDGKFSSQQIRELKIEDLLGRDPIWLQMDKVSQGLQGAVVLVTGAAGSIGSEIVRQLMAFHLQKVILLDQAESALYDLQNELLADSPQNKFEVVVANVTDKCHMRQVFEKYRPQYVFNAAAYKHVPLMEATPYEAIRVNVGGTRLLADLSVKYGVAKFVMISTDKAVNPTNVMGASKRICEIYIQALTQETSVKTQFITTRFGNVLGSNGSVVPLFKKQIEAGGPVTVTHRDIIRYFMTIPEACQLVLEAGFMGNGGEIYVFDMGEPVKIYDLAVKMISLAGLKPNEDIAIEFTGLRPGEKLYEELLANEENSIQTHHPKIKAAKVRTYPFETIQLAVDELIQATQTETEHELVYRMKALVPEFISQNSAYCKCDESLKEKRRETTSLPADKDMKIRSMVYTVAGGSSIR